MTDRRILLLCAFLRAFATGLMGVLLGLHLARLQFNAAQISVGLSGAALSALIVGGAMKIGYDVLLYFSFRGRKPPEEKIDPRENP